MRRLQSSFFHQCLAPRKLTLQKWRALLNLALFEECHVSELAQQASREVAEAIIAHQTGSLTERAYNRTDFLEQRRELMEAWERYLNSAG